MRSSMVTVSTAMPLQVERQYSQRTANQPPLPVRELTLILYISRSNNVKNGSKDLKRYPQISRRVRDTLARLLPEYWRHRLVQL